MRNTIAGTLTGVTSVLLLFSGANAWAQNFPTKPVTMVVSTGPGASNDLEARMYGQKLSESLGQPFVVDYKPGGGTTLAAIYVSKAAPDGYTLLGMSSSFPAAAALYRPLPYDPLKDFTPLSIMSKRSTVLIAHPSAPFKTLQEYIAYSRANPGKVNVATVGAGSGPHINAAWFHSLTNTQATFIHYKSAAAMQSDLMSGRVDITYASLFTGLPHIKSGKMRLLAMGNAERNPQLPDVPTVAELGVAGYDYNSMFGFVGPAGMQPAVVSRLSTEMARAVKSPEVAKRLESEGGMAVGSTPAQLAQILAADVPRYRKLVDELGIKPEE
jgi:tripartite-type tricarboxylate transporter receptor subunit TctC